MVFLQINASILEHKQYEFNQSKLSFINDLQHFEGYNGFTEKRGEQFQINIAWNTKKNLNEFMNAEAYKFFHGAIVTLSKSNKVIIINDPPKSIRTSVNI